MFLARLLRLRSGSILFYGQLKWDYYISTMGKTFLPGIVRNILSQPLRLDTKALCHPYGVLTILAIMVLVALLLSYIMITYCNDNCTSGNHTFSTCEIKNYRDLTLTRHDPGSIFILYESKFNNVIHQDGNSTAIPLNAFIGRVEKLPKLLSPLIT